MNKRRKLVITIYRREISTVHIFSEGNQGRVFFCFSLTEMKEGRGRDGRCKKEDGGTQGKQGRAISATRNAYHWPVLVNTRAKNNY